MTWTKQRHTCLHPMLAIAAVFQPIGDEWTCDVCGKVYVVTRVGDVKRLIPRARRNPLAPASDPEPRRATRAEQWKEQAERSEERALAAEARLREAERIMEQMLDVLSGVSSDPPTRRNNDDVLHLKVQDAVLGALRWWNTEGFDNPEYGGTQVDAIADRVMSVLRKEVLNG